LTLLRRWGRLYLTLLSSLLSRRWGRWLHLTLLWRWWGRLNRRLRRRLHLTLLWRWRAWPLRRLFLFFLICLSRLGDYEHAIQWRGVC
jgi:hypothetical protein